MRDDGTFERSEDGTDEVRRRGLEDDRQTKAARRVQCGGVIESATLETGGRTAALFGTVRICLPRELAEFELSNDDDRDWPRRVVAE